MIVSTVVSTLLTVLVFWGCAPGPMDSAVAAGMTNIPDPLIYLIKDSSLADLFEIDKSGVSFFSDQVKKKAHLPEWKVYAEEYAFTRRLLACMPSDSLARLLEQKGTDSWPDELKDRTCKPAPSFQFSGDSTIPLSGLKVALDPGHVAGDIQAAEWERKYVKMRPSRRTRYQAIAFHEANLTLATAHLIREELEALGAEVFMTRTQSGISAMGMSYEAWKVTQWEKTMEEEVKAGSLSRAEMARWKKESNEGQIMQRFFTPEDLKARAKAINSFRPHLTLIIHYNVHAPNWYERDIWGFLQPTDANYSMAFTPGSFMRGELNEQADKTDFLRLILTQDILKSMQLCDAFIRYSTILTGVEAVTEEEELSYLSRSSILTPYQGVYARNLSLTRMIKGPVCYGESFCQDNVLECRRLNKKTIQVEGIWVSDRVQWVARAYVEAVKEFVMEGR